MIEIDIEVCEGGSSIRTAVRAESILHADDIVRDLYPGGEVAVVFPIDSGTASSWWARRSRRRTSWPRKPVG